MRRTGIGFFILSIIFCLVVGTIVLRMNAKLDKNCTETTTGVLIGYHEEYSTDSDGSGSYSYFPIYQYRVNGKLIESQSNTGSGNKKYQEGTEFTIFYNPDNYYEFYVEGDNTLKVIGWVAYGFAFFLFVIMVLTALGIVKPGASRTVATVGAGGGLIALITALVKKSKGE